MKIPHGAWDNLQEPVGFVYRNLHKHCWSIRINGLVAIHASHVVLKDAQFKVSAAGRQRVINEQRKNVHAGVVGRLHFVSAIDIRHPVFGIKSFTPGCLERVSNLTLVDGERVTYNPYKMDCFQFLSGTEVEVEPDQFVELSALREVWVGSTLK